MTTITKLEMQALKEIANCDFSSDGNGLHSPTYQLNFDLPMNQVRALLSTLSQKGIVGVTSAEDMGETFGWVRIKDEYAVESDDETIEFVKRTGYKLTNLEVK